MRAHGRVTTALACLGLAVSCQAYWVDGKSCGVVPFNKLFLQLVKEGYDMADIAVKNMQTDTKTKDFAKLIFKDDQCIAQAKGSLEKVTQNKARSYSANSKDAIVIYCDEKRHTKKPSDYPQAYDPDNDRYMGFDLGDSPCIESKQNYAYTVTGDHRQPAGYPVSIVQLCPWYLENVGVPTATNSLAGLKPDDQKIKDALNDWEQTLGADGKAQIDTFALLPTTLLHEFMHSTFVGQMTDPPDRSYTYWDNVRHFQATGTCAVNPETLAFMGLGAKLVEQGWTINADGSMKKATKKKRSSVAWVA